MYRGLVRYVICLILTLCLYLDEKVVDRWVLQLGKGVQTIIHRRWSYAHRLVGMWVSLGKCLFLIHW